MLAAGASKPRKRLGIGLRGLLRRAWVRALGRYLAREGDRVGFEAVLAGELVDKPCIERLLRGDRIALGGHFEREPHARDPR